MSNFFEGMDEAIANLKAQQARIGEASERMTKVTGSATSKDRMVTATVDSKGRLVDLKLKGTRYRQLAPAELTARIVETVREAQEQAASEAASTFAGLLPPGLGIPIDGKFDLDAMFDEAVSVALRPMPTEEAKQNKEEDNG
jgi:DNA-binding protein YbaB